MGVDKQKYIEVLVTGDIKFDSRYIVIKGKGKKSKNIYESIECLSYHVEFI